MFIQAGLREFPPFTKYYEWLYTNNSYIEVVIKLWKQSAWEILALCEGHATNSSIKSTIQKIKIWCLDPFIISVRYEYAMIMNVMKF